MAEQTIVGVDFSGAKKDNATGITKASLDDKKILRIKDCGTIKRNDLTKFLKGLKNDSDAVVALDFPFGVPRAFAEELARKKGKKRPSQMPDLWSIVAEPGMDYSSFQRLRSSFVSRHGQIHRRNDLYLRGPLSPLKDSGNPIMFLMTFHGMRMLHELRRAGCRVPPLPDGNCKGPILLETMPGVLLRLFGLPHQGYKRNSKAARKNRETILGGLLDKGKSGVSLAIPKRLKEECLKDDNCLDSLVAAIGAAMWAQADAPSHALLEGCIHVPKV